VKPRGRLGAWAWRLAIVALAALGIAVVVDALGGGKGSEPAAHPAPRLERITGPNVPQPAALEGTLYIAEGDDCRLTAIDLQQITQGDPGPETSCGLWTAPAGRLAAVTRAAHDDQTEELWLVELADPPRLLRRVGPLAGDPSWAADGKRLAWCTPDGSTVVLEVATGSRTHVRGCRPKLTPEGILTRPNEPLAFQLLEGGVARLDRSELARPFRDPGSHIDVLGFDASADGLLAVAVAEFTDPRPRAWLELWRGHTLLGAFVLPIAAVPGPGFLDELVRFSPSGQEIAIGLARGTFELLVVDAQTHRLRLEPSLTKAFTWSPDGAWLVRSTGSEIVFSSAERSERVYTVPLAAFALAWR